MALAGLLGVINGAATRYSTRLEQAAENNASLTERMIKNRGLASTLTLVLPDGVPPSSGTTVWN